MNMTSADYQYLIDNTDSPLIRREWERLQRQAVEREAFLARVGELGRRDVTTLKWQRETLLELRRLFAQLFEVRTWEARETKPALAWEVRNDLNRKLRGMAQRIARGRREAAEGYQLQAQWLADHQELITAVESGE